MKKSSLHCVLTPNVPLPAATLPPQPIRLSVSKTVVFELNTPNWLPKPFVAA